MTHSLLVSSSTFPDCFRYEATNGYETLGSTLKFFPLKSLAQAIGTTCIVADTLNKQLYVRGAGQVITRFSYTDFAMFEAAVTVDSGVGYGANFLLTADAKQLVVRRYAGIVLVPVLGGAGQPFADLTDLGSASVMRWGPDGDLYVLVNVGSDYPFPEVQQIAHFDGKTGKFKQIIGPAFNGVNGLKFTSDFDIAADGSFYTLAFHTENWTSQIERRDAASAALTSVVVKLDDTMDIRQIQFSPDRNILYGLGLNHIYEFSPANGSLIQSYGLAVGSASSLTFIDDPPISGPGSAVTAIVSEILSGIVAGNSGWVHVPGKGLVHDPGDVARGLDGPIRFAAAKAWQEMPAAERDIVLAVGINLLAQQMQHEGAAKTVSNLLTRELGSAAAARMDALAEQLQRLP